MLKYLVLLLAAGLAAACTPLATATQAAVTPPATLELRSPAFALGEAIPQKYTCQGDNVSPPLEWSQIPDGALSLALIVEDPDAPMRTWVHWVLYNLPPTSTGLPEHVADADLPEGTLQGKSSFGKPGYGGPCPPTGQHRYYFHLYALDIRVDAQDLDKAALLKAAEGHILAEGEWMGVDKKP